jgi:hypothetical protein
MEWQLEDIGPPQLRKCYANVGNKGKNCRHGEVPAHTFMHAEKWSELEKM